MLEHQTVLNTRRGKIHATKTVLTSVTVIHREWVKDT
jgi:hypothetical protein